MDGLQFFWRVTLLSGTGTKGKFKIEVHTLALGEPSPDEIPYRKRGSPVSYDGLKRIPYVGSEVSNKALELSKQNPQAEFKYERQLGI